MLGYKSLIPFINILWIQYSVQSDITLDYYQEGYSTDEPTIYFYCFPNETISLHLVCNGEINCSNEEDEKPSRCGCPGNFNCGETCIQNSLKCDGKTDCPDGRDEENCDIYSCQQDQFKCNNNICISVYLTCNYYDDCGDSSDEMQCDYRFCWDGELECKVGNACYRPGEICDGHNSCEDGQDEQDCEPENFVVCEDGTRIHKTMWCDGNLNCRGNHTDETVCGECTSNQYRCSNGRCLTQAQICDGQCDCVPDCSDEARFCGNTYETIDGVNLPLLGTSVGCFPPFHPLEKELIIHADYICDGVIDCYYEGYAPDEFNCPGRGLSSTVYGYFTKWSQNSTHYFQCTGDRDGRWLPAAVKCNYRNDCLHGEDELGCDFPKCMENEFECRNHQCVNISSRCNNKIDCYDKSDELNCGSLACDPLHRKCKSHQCIPSSFWCDREKDCLDGSDEEDCEYRTCQDDEFRCNNGQCIPLSHICIITSNPKDGCADKSHLIDCENATCGPGFFKCLKGPCLNESLVCDGDIQCGAYWNDENRCRTTCSNIEPRCRCKDIVADCTNLGLRSPPTDLDPAVSFFNFSRNFLGHELKTESLNYFGRANLLDLSGNKITALPAGIFRDLTKLKILRLENNQITLLSKNTFQGLHNLRMLSLQGNQIEMIEAFSFEGLKSLSALDLSGQNLKQLSPAAFIGLSRVTNLDLSRNTIREIRSDIFKGLVNLLQLDISTNEIEKLDLAAFRGLAGIRLLITDEMGICCAASHSGVANCTPAADEFSSCEDLMSNSTLRTFLWVLGICAVFGNFFVVIWRLWQPHGKKCHALLAVNLAVGDFCMGIYLLLIASVDYYHRGVYALHEHEWRSSELCKFAGFVSTFSAEFSVFILTLITLERFFVVAFPFRAFKLNTTLTRKLVVFCWLLALLIATLPLMDHNYFRNFYGRSGVCLALHLTDDKPSGWEYSVFVFIVLNAISVFTMILCYTWIYVAARSTHEAVGSDNTVCDERSMAMKMLIIVSTDAACWLPTICLGFLSLAGYSAPKNVYAWVAAFVLPLNSALNPMLYTFLVPGNREKLRLRILALKSTLSRTLSFKSRGTSSSARRSLVRLNSGIRGSKCLSGGPERKSASPGDHTTVECNDSSPALSIDSHKRKSFDCPVGSRDVCENSMKVISRKNSDCPVNL